MHYALCPICTICDGRVSVSQSLLSAPEAEHIVGALQSFGVDQVCLLMTSWIYLVEAYAELMHMQIGSHAWRAQHGHLTQLNLQVSAGLL